MKTEQKVITSAGIASVAYVEEGVLWFTDRLIDLALAYKDQLMGILTSLV